jgi:hypothetical protein
MEESNDQAGASGLPAASVIDANAPELNHQYPTVTVRRKVAKRSEEWYNKPPPQNSTIAVSPSPSPSPHAEDIPARKKRRTEEPLLPLVPAISTDEASTAYSNTASAKISECPSPPVMPPSSTDTANASTRHQSPRETQTQTQPPPIETSEDQVDGNDDDDVNAVANVRHLSKPPWENCLSELADYRKSNGHCNVPQRYIENTKLGTWVAKQRHQYGLHQVGKKSSMTISRIQQLERLGFKWRTYRVWEDHLSELADYRKINGHCNVPQHYIENTKLGTWVAKQRYQYRLHLKGKPSRITLSRIQALESLGFEKVRNHLERTFEQAC